MKRFCFLLLFIVCSIGFVFAQNDFSCPQVDCPGQCGAFIDENHDGFCDHGQLSEAAKKKLRAGQQETQAPEKKASTKNQSNTAAIEEQTEEYGQTADAESELQPVTDETSEETMHAAVRHDSPYHLISISLGLTILYLITLILSHKKIITKITHRKIWNIILLISFLMSGILGLVLTFFLNYGYHPACYLTLKILHVEFGIAMGLVSIFHILWHIPYFKNLFK